jgi:hypothetical protein
MAGWIPDGVTPLSFAYQRKGETVLYGTQNESGSPLSVADMVSDTLFNRRSP